MSNSITFSKRSVFKYVALPGIRPRIGELFGKGFQYVPYFIALVYECVRLLPRNHPYVDPKNMGRYGLRHVIAEAANNLVFEKKNIDQIAVFFLILIAMIIVIVQMLLVVVALFFQPAFAGAFPINFAEFFLPGAYGGVGTQQDLALILLDMVFGVPEMFGSCVDQVVNAGIACQSTSGEDVMMSTDAYSLIANPGPSESFVHWAVWPYPVHEGLHQLFAVYSYGMLVVAVFVTLYFMATVLAETAQTGTPFGKRFNKVWAPLRIVVAFGLLVPITLGMNSGQFIVLYAAKFGSGFASNGWAYFNSQFAAGQNYHEGWHELVSIPNGPEFGGLAQFFLAAATCKSSYMLGDDYTEDPADPNHIVPYLVRSGLTLNTNAMALTPLPGAGIPGDAAIAGATPYQDIMAVGGHAFRSNKLVLRFGQKNIVEYGRYLGGVKPFCGEVVLNLEDSRPAGVAEPGVEVVQRYYWWLVKALWWGEGRLQGVIGTSTYSEHYARKNIASLDFTAAHIMPTATFRQNMMARFDVLFREVLTGTGGPDSGGLGNAVDAQRASTTYELTNELKEKGWAGAALWYNKIAQASGVLISAVNNVPVPTLYPDIMEQVQKARSKGNQNVAAADRFKPDLSDNRQVPISPEGLIEYARAMNDAYSYWMEASAGASTQTEPTKNIIIDAINTILGTNGLYDMRKNVDVHPLAQLVGVGRSLIEAAIRNLGWAMMGSGASALLGTLQAFAGIKALAGTASSFLITIAMVGLTAGFIMYYIIPFLPFIYFFFAVGGWVKGIFEAMVGVPLWALAHIRIDGDGLPGQAAINGYFLIFEIFIRPILIIFGFLASILIFSAMVSVLNDIFDLVVGNVGGFDMHEEMNDTAGTGMSYMAVYRSAIDEFFFTVMYAIIVYMMGQSSFKLIDQIPNNILRWMNQNVSSFNDSRSDPAEGLIGTAHTGTQQGLSSLGGGLQGLTRMG